MLDDLDKDQVRADLEVGIELFTIWTNQHGEEVVYLGTLYDVERDQVMVSFRPLAKDQRWLGITLLMLWARWELEFQKTLHIYPRVGE